MPSLTALAKAAALAIATSTAFPFALRRPATLREVTRNAALETFTLFLALARSFAFPDEVDLIDRIVSPVSRSIVTISGCISHRQVAQKWFP